MLWLVARLMAHDLPWKFFSERYWNRLIKRAILLPTSASTCTDIKGKGKAPREPTRDAAQLVALEPLHRSGTWAARAPLRAAEASRINLAPHEAGSTSFLAWRDWKEDPFSSLCQRKPQVKLGLSEPPDLLPIAKDRGVCRKGVTEKGRGGNDL